MLGLVLVLVMVMSLLLASAGAWAGNRVGDGGGYRLARWTVDGGGVGHTQGGSYLLGATAGQADAGWLDGDGYALTGGFWGTLEGKVAIYLPLVLKAG
jgi:hypothetical protein